LVAAECNEAALGVGLEKEVRKNTTERGVHGVSSIAF
jgi:hypothetical protein